MIMCGILTAVILLYSGGGDGIMLIVQLADVSVLLTWMCVMLKCAVGPELRWIEGLRSMAIQVALHLRWTGSFTLCHDLSGTLSR